MRRWHNLREAPGCNWSFLRTLDDAWLERQARILEMVLDFACSMPFKGRGELQYPPLIRLRATQDESG